MLPIGSNDFLPLIGPATGNAPVNYFTNNYVPSNTNATGLFIAAQPSGTSLASGMNISGFGVAALLAIPIPATAAPGQTYTLSVLVPSGTSDGQGRLVNINPLGNQLLIVSNLVSFAGDASPANGYNSGEFGDGVLNNADVNTVLLAVNGIHVPPTSSDAWKAMDVYPETPSLIGDDRLTLLDWQTVLNRALGLDTNNWIRSRGLNGKWTHQRILWSPGSAPIPLDVRPETGTRPTEPVLPPPPPLGLIWLRTGVVSSQSQPFQVAGSVCSMPVYVTMSPGKSLSALTLRAEVSANGNAPTPGAETFTPAAGISTPLTLSGGSADDMVYAWSLGELNPPLIGRTLLGTITFQIPAAAQSGQSYTLRFRAVDGAADLSTPLPLESFPAFAWVGVGPRFPDSRTSDEWKIAFFGSLTNELAADDADPDGDGAPNWQEYLAGTDPTKSSSNLHFSGPALAGGGLLKLGWLSAPGKTYVLEWSPALPGGSWTPIATNCGDGNECQFTQTNLTGNTRFFRIRLQP